MRKKELFFEVGSFGGLALAEASFMRQSRVSSILIVDD